jgi:hypothetical protein
MTLPALFAVSLALAAPITDPGPAQRPVRSGPRVGVTLGAAGGWSQETRQPWAGVDLAVHSTQHKGFAPFARLDLAYGFSDALPFGTVEAGFTGVAPHKEATIRFGLIARALAVAAPYPVPLQIGEVDPSGTGPAHLGFAPGGLGLFELEWGNARIRTQPGRVERGGVEAFVIGFRAGANMSLYQNLCELDQPVSDCVAWRPDFVGGFTSRIRLRNGLSAEVVLGANLTAVIGYTFPVKRPQLEPAPPPEPVLPASVGAPGPEAPTPDAPSPPPGADAPAAEPPAPEAPPPAPEDPPTPAGEALTPP